MIYPVGTPLLFWVLMLVYRDDIRKLVTALKEEDAKHGTFTYAHELVDLNTSEETTTNASSTTTDRARTRRPSLVAHATDLRWLSSKFDKFEPLAWWANAYLIAMRLLQSSAMVFISNASLQATVASLIALVGISVQRNASPCRRQSE